MYVCLRHKIAYQLRHILVGSEMCRSVSVSGGCSRHPTLHVHVCTEKGRLLDQLMSKKARTVLDIDIDIDMYIYIYIYIFLLYTSDAANKEDITKQVSLADNRKKTDTYNTHKSHTIHTC